MAYTHCLVVFLTHNPDADRSCRLFHIVGLDVQSFPDLRRTLNTMCSKLDSFAELVDERQKFREHPVALEPITYFICTMKAWFFPLIHPVSKERLLVNKPPYRPLGRRSLSRT